MLELVQLVELADRRPAQLSGGQRQRISLARALINQPRVLLLDEPLGALDLKLREEMQIELRNLQRRLGVAFVFVTHDQGEALSMADRVAVFNHGRIEQLDTPRRLYMQPRTHFVARFVGSANVVTGELAQRLSAGRRRFRDSRRKCSCDSAPDERVGDDSIACEGVVVDVQYHGAMSRWQVRLDDGAVFAASLAGRRRTEQLRHRRARAAVFRRSDVIALARTANERGRRIDSFARIADCAASRRGCTDAIRCSSSCCSSRRFCGSARSTWGRCSRCLCRASIRSTSSRRGSCTSRRSATYAQVVTQPANIDIILRTLIMAIVVTIACALIALPIANYMVRYASPRARALFYVGVMLPMWTSYLVKVYAWRLILAKQGVLSWLLESLGLSGALDVVLATPGVGGPSLASSYLGMFIVFVYMWLPFMILPLAAALERVPDSLLQASADLGARPVQTFRTVTLPLALPGLAAGSVFTFSLTLGDYIIPSVVGAPGYFIGMMVYEQQGTAGNLPLAAAFSVVPIVLIMIYLTLAKRAGAFDAL